MVAAGSAIQAVVPVVGGKLRKLLGVVFALFVLLALNSLYLGAVTLLEELTGLLAEDAEALGTLEEIASLRRIVEVQSDAHDTAG